jgi:hypothetical protein
MVKTVSASHIRWVALSLLLLGGLGGLGFAAMPPAVPPAPSAAPPGVTALSGRVMSNDGKPLVNVALRDGSAGTRTDGEGRFLLAKLPSGTSVLTIDGRHAGTWGRTDYGLFEVQIQATAGQTTSMPFTSYLPLIDHAHEVAIAYPTTSDVVVKSATIAGLELRIPAGAYVTDTEGKPVTRIGITEIPVARPPYPLPAEVQVPVYFTAQPGGATITGVDGKWLGAQVVYPNYHHELPKARHAFWRYDPFKEGWAVYGIGRVSPDGTQVIPDPKTRIYDLTGAMISSGTPPDRTGNCTCPVCCGAGAGGGGGAGGAGSFGAPSAGDPVDLASGLWVEPSTDLSLADVLPLALTRRILRGRHESRL